MSSYLIPLIKIIYIVMTIKVKFKMMQLIVSKIGEAGRVSFQNKGSRKNNKRYSVQILT